MVLATYPLDNMDYSAADAELFHCTRTSGIYANDDFAYSVTGVDNTMTIGVGLAWIRNSRFSGKVVALKEDQSLDFGISDAVYPRIDAAVIQFNANKNRTEIVVKQGTPASTPAAPEVSKTEELYELHLYHIRREPGATVITVSDIMDRRLDPNYCGLMADSVTKVDTAAISAQAMALIEELRTEIGNVKDGSAYLMRSGGNMTGAINMNGQVLKGLNAPVADDEAVNYGTLKKVARVEKTLTAAGWVPSDTAGFIQSVMVDGLTDEKKCKVYPAIPATLIDKLAQAEETSKIKACTRSGATVTFEAWEEVPVVDITVVVEVFL